VSDDLQRKNAEYSWSQIAWRASLFFEFDGFFISPIRGRKQEKGGRSDIFFIEKGITFAHEI
jgi:hypothetical protein